MVSNVLRNRKGLRLQTMTQIKKDTAKFLNLNSFAEDEILLIPIDRLIKDVELLPDEVGDITALADNIGKNGVLKNLIVVPCTGHHYGKYLVVSGYREFEAARIADVEELPCRIVHMDDKEQLEVVKLYG